MTILQQQFKKIENKAQGETGKYLLIYDLVPLSNMFHRIYILAYLSVFSPSRLCI